MNEKELVFLGSSGCNKVPEFTCSSECETCEAARRDPRLCRTRASIALLGEEIVIVDTSPDLETQLEREAIRQINRIFITHWHWDHIAGLGALGEPASILKWPPIDIYLPSEVAFHFDQELAYMKKSFNVHPVKVGDRIELPDARWEVVKTTHTDNSIGYIITSSKRFAYLVDSVVPPADTVKRLENMDFLILEATVDRLDEKGWGNFSLQEAISFWQTTGIERCILTHLSCHSWKSKKLLPGISEQERRDYESRYPGLTFAYDGLRVPV